MTKTIKAFKILKALASVPEEQLRTGFHSLTSAYTDVIVESFLLCQEVIRVVVPVVERRVPAIVAANENYEKVLQTFAEDLFPEKKQKVA